MYIAIIDDDKMFGKQLSDMIAEKLTALGYTDLKLDIFESGQSFLSELCNVHYDIAVIDIFMDEITGIEIAKKLRSQDENIKIVFCSSSNEFAAESYDVAASYYIHKPVTYKQIDTMLKRMKLDMLEKNKILVLSNKQPIILGDIVYTDYLNHVVTIHMKNGDIHKIRTSQMHMEEILLCHDYFFSPVKGIIINFYEVVKMDSSDFILKNGKVIHITRRKVREAKEAYLKFRFDSLKRESVG